MSSTDLTKRFGDCILRLLSMITTTVTGVDGPDNVATDIGRPNVLISRDFYYFPSRAIF